MSSKTFKLTYLKKWHGLPGGPGAKPTLPKQGTQVQSPIRGTRLHMLQLKILNATKTLPNKQMGILIFYLILASAFSSCNVQAFHCGGFSCCRAQALEHMRFSSCGSQAPEQPLQHVGSSQARNRTSVLCTAR